MYGANDSMYTVPLQFGGAYTGIRRGGGLKLVESLVEEIKCYGLAGY